LIAVRRGEPPVTPVGDLDVDLPKAGAGRPHGGGDIERAVTLGRVSACRHAIPSAGNQRQSMTGCLQDRETVHGDDSYDMAGAALLIALRWLRA
jgi:hypothetical protein